MKCSDIEELLSAYANGELSRTQREFVEEHLSGCADCRAALADYTAVRHQLTSLRTAPVRSDIKEATMSKIRAADILKRPFQRLLRPALIVVPVVAILVTLLVLQPWGTSLVPRSVMAEAYAATEGLQSYRMFSFTTSTFEGKTIEQTFELGFAALDRYHGKMTLDGETHEFIIIGDKQYNRELGSDQSRKMGVAVSGSIPSKEDTLELLDILTDLEKLPDEQIDSVDCLHYRGRVDMERMVEEQMASLDPEQPGYEEMVKSMEQALEEACQMKTEVELWIGKDDYLIRQMKYDMQMPAENTGQWNTSSSVVRYHDLNKPIIVEPPVTASGELLPGWRLQSSSQNQQELPFSRDVTFTIGGNDPAYQQISFRITITNIGVDVASNVRVALATMATNEESNWIWNSPEPVTLEPGESETYHITWEYDASDTSKKELARLVNLTTILAKYTTPEGEESVQLLFPDAPYPSIQAPPEEPPR